MNKKDIFLIVGAVFILLLAVLLIGGNKKELLTLSSDEVGLISLDYNTYEEKIANKENFIVVLERTGCSYCEEYLPVLETVTNELGVAVYDINIAEITEEEYNLLGESNSYLRRENWGTPTTLIMSGDTVVDSISGYVDEKYFREFIEKNIVLTSEENSDVE